jgi:ABC-type amino acid transport substrate-binding protein
MRRIGNEIVDPLAGATYSPERDRYAYFSKPYRSETDVLILPRGKSSQYPFHTIDEMLDLFTRQHFRLGVTAGFTYADAAKSAFPAASAARCSSQAMSVRTRSTPITRAIARSISMSNPVSTG